MYVLQIPEYGLLGKFPLGNERYVVVCSKAKKILVDVRQFERSSAADSLLYATRVGATFTPQRWAEFRMNIEEIDKHVELLKDFHKEFHFKVHLGGSVYCTVDTGYQCVHIRSFFLSMNGSKMLPSKFGIALRIGEWNTLKALIDEISNVTPLLKEARPCYLDGRHDNQEGALSCRECYPHGDSELLYK